MRKETFRIVLLFFVLIFPVCCSKQQEVKTDNTQQTSPVRYPGKKEVRPFMIGGIPERPLKFEENGKIQGIDIEILEYIMKQMDIKYQIVLVKSSKRLKRSWESDKSGMFDMFITFSQKKSRLPFLYFPEESHLSLTWNFFIRKEDEGKITYSGAFTDFKGYTMGMTEGVAYTDALWKAAIDGTIGVDYTVSHTLQIEKLLRKRVDVIPCNSMVMLYEARQDGYAQKISFLENPLKKQKYYNAFAKNSSYPGIEKIKKQYDIELRKMKEAGIIENILKKYLGPEDPGFR